MSTAERYPGNGRARREERRLRLAEGPAHLHLEPKTPVLSDRARYLLVILKGYRDPTQPLTPDTILEGYNALTTTNNLPDPITHLPSAETLAGYVAAETKRLRLAGQMANPERSLTPEEIEAVGWINSKVTPNHPIEDVISDIQRPLYRAFPKRNSDPSLPPRRRLNFRP